MVIREESYKYYEEEINAVTDKATQTDEALKTFNKEDPYYFLRKHPSPKAVFRPDGGFTTIRGHYISERHRRDFN
jgi:hypothetical protein